MVQAPRTADPTTVADPTASGARRLPMTYEEYLAFGDDTTHAEWIAGEVEITTPPSIRHGLVIRLLVSLVGGFADPRGLGEVFTAPVAMRLAASTREPDIMFVATRHLDRLADQQLDGPADLVIEVISEDSVARDRKAKFAEYQAARVAEYWILDARPGRARDDLFQLIDGRFRAIVPDAAGRYQSLVMPGLWYDPAWLRQSPLPRAIALLAQMLPDVLRLTPADVAER